MRSGTPPHEEGIFAHTATFCAKPPPASVWTSSLERVTQTETQRHGHAGISRKDISVGIMRDFDFGVYVSFMSRKNSQAHEILERELSSGLVVVDDRPRNECW